MSTCRRHGPLRLGSASIAILAWLASGSAVSGALDSTIELPEFEVTNRTLISSEVGKLSVFE